MLYPIAAVADLRFYYAQFDLIYWSVCPFADWMVNWAMCYRHVIDFISTAACFRERNC